MNKLLSIASLTFAACVAADEADLATVQSDVVNGDAIDPNNTGIVEITTPRYVCSGLLLDNRFVVTAAHCTESELDFQHGLRGQAFVSYSTQAISPRAVAVDPAGHEIMAGSTAGKLFIARTRNDGSGQLDPYFGKAGGRIVTDIATTTDEALTALAIDSQGRIVAAGTATTSAGLQIIVLARYQLDGTLDSHFGTNGIALANIPNSSSETASGVAVDAYGYIYVAATAQMSTKQVAVMRFRSDGVYDSSFDGNGIRIADINPGHDQIVNGLALDASSRPVVVGSTDGAAFVARFTTSGPPDTTFNGHGSVVLRKAGSWTQGNALAIDASGRIVIAGESSDTKGMLAGRVTAGGALDTTFSGDGWVAVTPRADYVDAVASSVVIDSQGRIVMGGTATDLSYTRQFAGARLLATGAPDRSFDIDGMAASWAIDGYNNAYEALGVGVAVAANDDVVVGFSELSPTAGAGFARFNGDQMVTAAPADARLVMGSQTRGATTVFRNPSLDVAIFELASPMAMSGNSTTYQFAGFYMSAPSTLVGKTVDCYGYGLNTQTTGVGTLRHATLPVTSASADYFDVGVNTRDQSLWKGDSGGPCFYNTGTKWLVAGIASRGVFDSYLEEVAGSAYSEWTGWIRAFN